MPSTTRTVFRELLRGKSLGRTLVNLRLADIELAGQGLDLGSKSGRASYYRFMKLAPGTRLVYTDLHPEGPEVLRVDLNDGIPVDGASQDFLLLFNTLEHIYDYRACLAECRRALRPGGRLIGYVPFLYRVHPDPEDFHRLTDQALSRALAGAGFDRFEISAYGFGPIYAAVEQVLDLIPTRPLKTLAGLTALGLDRLLQRLFPGRAALAPAAYPLGYLFISFKD